MPDSNRSITGPNIHPLPWRVEVECDQDIPIYTISIIDGNGDCALYLSNPHSALPNVSLPRAQLALVQFIVDAVNGSTSVIRKMQGDINAVFAEISDLRTQMQGQDKLDMFAAHALGGLMHCTSKDWDKRPLAMEAYSAARVTMQERALQMINDMADHGVTPECE